MSNLIDRQAAIDAIKVYWKKVVDDISKDAGFEEVTRLCELALEHNAGILKAVDNLPSAEPERKKGTNIYYKAKGHCEFKCSICGAEAGVVEGRDLDGGHFTYCPNCGAKMEEEK